MHERGLIRKSGHAWLENTLKIHLRKSIVFPLKSNHPAISGWGTLGHWKYRSHRHLSRVKYRSKVDHTKRIEANIPHRLIISRNTVPTCWWISFSPSTPANSRDGFYIGKGLRRRSRNFPNINSLGLINCLLGAKRREEEKSIALIRQPVFVW